MSPMTFEASSTSALCSSAPRGDLLHRAAPPRRWRRSRPRRERCSSFALSPRPTARCAGCARRGRAGSPAWCAMAWVSSSISSWSVRGSVGERRLREVAAADLDRRSPSAAPRRDTRASAMVRPQPDGERERDARARRRAARFATCSNTSGTAKSSTAADHEVARAGSSIWSETVKPPAGARLDARDASGGAAAQRHEVRRGVGPARATGASRPAVLRASCGPRVAHDGDAPARPVVIRTGAASRDGDRYACAERSPSRARGSAEVIVARRAHGVGAPRRVERDSHPAPAHEARRCG